MNNQSSILKIQSENGFNKHKGKYHSIWILSTTYSYSKNTIGVWMVIIHADSTLTCINVIDWYGFYNNREEDSYAIQYNDGLQIMQWSNTTTSCISIDSIAKLSPRIQCISVIVPFGFYRIDCMILSIDWILSMNHSIDDLSLINRKIPKNTNHKWWLDYHYQSDSDWSILSNHSIHNQQYHRNQWYSIWL